MGTATMKAKVNSEDRPFSITAVQDEGVWKIVNLNFPDLLNY